MLIDAHCHLNSLSKSKKAEVIDFFSSRAGRIIDSSIDLNSSLDSLNLSKKLSFLYTSLGFHPFSCQFFSDNLYKQYKALLEGNNRVVALGEIGLDHKAETSLKQQEKIFRKWLELAKEKNLPVLIHVRLNQDNWYSNCLPGRPRILAILDDYFQDYQKVIFHCFSYPVGFLKQIIAKKGFISFSLNVLRKNKNLLESLKHCPASRLLLETDSPYMKIRGDLSSPLDIDFLYSYVACLRGIPEEEFKEVVFYNAKRVFANLV